MTQTFSKSRAKAEIAFSSVQSQFFSRSQGLEEQNAVVQARDEKTARLREARHASQAANLAAIAGKKAGKHPKKG